MAPVALTGVVQDYAWGDRAFIPELLGREPDGRPHAELWLGTHPNGPATTGDGRALHDLTGELPYLLKVLAAAEPLSLQLHPDADQAADGFARGVYPDPRAKPELLCALTRFEAFCGIRPVEATLALLGDLDAADLRTAVADGGPGAALRSLYLGELDPDPAIAACASSDRPEARWVRQLADHYPGDASVVVTLLLNHVVLEPGDALHLTAGNLHAYLGGAGIELMGPSDNVVRGGLTTKPVDVDELLRIVDDTALVEPVMRGPDDGVYPLPEAGCALTRVAPGATHVASGHEVAIAIDGGCWYLPPGTEWTPDAEAYVATTTLR